MSNIFSWDSLSSNLRTVDPEINNASDTTDVDGHSDTDHSVLHSSLEDSGHVTTHTNKSRKGHAHGGSHSRTHSLTSSNNSPAIVQLMRTSESTANHDKISTSSTSKPSKEKEPETTGLSFAEKMLDKFLASKFPPATMESHKRMAYQKDTQPFSVPVLTNNFRNLNSRIGVVFGTIYNSKVFACWEKPCFTLSIMLIYTLVILNIHLLPLVPVGFILFKIMTPAYVSRHYPDPNGGLNHSLDSGPPLADAIIPGPVPELSREFYMNLVDIQNLMPEYTRVFDISLKFLASFAYFKDDESLSSLVFVLLTLISILYIWIGPIIIRYIPWKFLFISGAWALVLINHPKAKENKGFVNRMALNEESINISISLRKNVKVDVGAAKAKARKVKAAVKPQQLHKFMDELSKKEFDTVFRQPHQQREVEIFELQLFDTVTNQWKEPHVFTQNSFVPSWLQTKALLLEHIERHNQADNPVKDDNQKVSNSSESRAGGGGTSGDGRRRSSGYAEPTQVFLQTKNTATEPSNTTPAVATPIYFPHGKPLISEILPPHQWEFVSDTPWKLDLHPETWVDKNYGAWKHQLRIDNDEKWVYDDRQTVLAEEPGDLIEQIPDAQEVAEPISFKCRRRRWVRTCIRKTSQRLASK